MGDIIFMTPSDLPELLFGGILWVDRKIPHFQVPRPNGFVSRAFRKIKILGGNFNY